MGQRYELGPALLTSTFTAATAFMVPIAVLFTLLFTLPYAIGEELGWRGFALPRLQARHEPLVASVILGLFWGFWHTPAWIAWDSTELALLPLTIMVLSTVVTAILFTWIFNRTGGSLLLVVLFHTSITSKGYFLPSLPTLTEEVLLALIALAVVFGGGLTIHKRVE
jgi:membrane protease YdiL (CAAX protease family)